MRELKMDKREFLTNAIILTLPVLLAVIAWLLGYMWVSVILLTYFYLQSDLERAKWTNRSFANLRSWKHSLDCWQIANDHTSEQIAYLQQQLYEAREEVKELTKKVKKRGRPKK